MCEGWRGKIARGRSGRRRGRGEVEGRAGDAGFADGAVVVDLVLVVVVVVVVVHLGRERVRESWGKGERVGASEKDDDQEGSSGEGV